MTFLAQQGLGKSKKAAMQKKRIYHHVNGEKKLLLDHLI
jgi:hypothetical protein